MRSEGDFGITALAGRFHADWWHGGTAMDQVVEFLADERGVLALRSDTHGLVASELADDELRTLWEAMAWHGLAPDESAARAWLGSIVSLCDDWLADHGFPAVRPVDRPYADEIMVQHVSNEIELLAAAEASAAYSEWSMTRGPAVRSLQRCCSLVSPGLAFRILVRIVWLHGLRITAEQYTQYRRLTAMLSYGDKLVDEISYLVT